jgi:hypothetical protein
MNPLLCTIAYCQKDLAATQELVKWIGELGGCKNHPCLLVSDSKVSGRDRGFLKLECENLFSHVQEIEFTEIDPPAGLRWPVWRWHANQMFLRAIEHVFANCRLPFLWLESDATPMRSGWLDEISESYYAQPMRFHGPIIRATEPRPEFWPERHMAGVAVYPSNAVLVLRKWCGHETTWDLGGGPDVVPKASKCRLIQHSYGVSETEAWSFAVKDGKVTAVNGDGTFQPREDCALFHRVKDGSLIRALRELREMECAAGISSWTKKTISRPDGSENVLTDPSIVVGINGHATPPEPVVVKRRPGRPRKISQPVTQ